MELNVVEKYRSGRKKQAGASLAARSNHTKTARVVSAGAGNTPPVSLVCRDADDVPTDNTTQQKGARSTYSLSRSGNTTTLRE